MLLKERYRAIRPIGEGAFGRTFLAVDEHLLQTSCVIKQFLPQIQETTALEKATTLFKQEAQRLHELGEHPQIPALFAYFEQDQRLYLVEEWIDGHNLLQELQQQGAFSEEKIQNLLLGLLPVLQFVHARQVIHRDIKPDNIVRRNSPQPGASTISAPASHRGKGSSQIGQFVLVDFGVAKQISGIVEAKTGTRTGTTGYAPIEQIRGGKAYPASDLYSLGVTCIHLLTGVTPDDLFDSLEGEWVWRSHLTQQGRSVSSLLGKILDKLLKDLVKERYQSAAEVLQDLVNYQQNGSLEKSTVNPVNLSVAAAKTSPPPTIASQRSTPKKTRKPDQIQAELAAASAELNPGEKVASPPIAHLSNQQQTRSSTSTVDSELEEIKASHPPRMGLEADLESVKFEYSNFSANIRSNQPSFPPWQCVHRLRGHSATVNTVAISQSLLNSSDQGGIIASGSDDQKIKIWDLETGQLLHTFFGHSAPIDAVAISPDGRILVSGGVDRKIIEWRLDTRAMVRELYSNFGSPQSHRYGTVHSVAISPDLGIIASGSADKSIKIWNLSKGELLHKLLGHSDQVLSVKFSPNGKILASGSADQTIKIWRLGTWEDIATLMGHSGRVYSVAFSLISPQTSLPSEVEEPGVILASGSADATIKLWAINTGKIVKTLIGHSQAVLSVAISPDGETLASGSRDETVKIWHLKTGELLYSLSGRNPVAFSPDGQTLVTGGDEGKILIWRTSPSI